MSEHAPGCRTLTIYPPNCGGFGVVEQRCVPECPVRRRMLHPTRREQIEWALRYMRERYSRPWGGWPRG